MSYFSTQRPASGSTHPYTLALLRAATSYLDADSYYEKWFRIGAAIYTVTSGRPDGFEVFNDWSASGRKYPGRSKVRKQWEYYSHNRGRPITMGSLRRYVEEAGVSWASGRRGRE